MRFLSLLLPLLLTGSLTNCTRPASPAKSTTTAATASSPATTQPPSPAAPAESTYAIRFERTPCMGKCPTFTLEIEPDGHARYEGRTYAPLEGEKELVFKREVLSNVEQLAKKMKFDQMPEDEYGHGMMDAPSAIVSLRQPSGELKTVKCTGMECPPELLALHKYLDRELRAALGVEEE